IKGSLTAHVGVNNVPRFALTANVSLELDTTGVSPFVRVVANGVTLSVAGQTLSGDFSFQQSAGVTTVAIANGALALTGISLSHGTGTLTLTATGVAGSLTGDVAVTIPGVSFTGSLALQLDSAAGDIDTRVATRHVRISGTGVHVTIAGQSIGGDFTFEQNADGVLVTLHNGTLSLGSVVDVQQADGTLSIASAGVTADLTVTHFTF